MPTKVRLVKAMIFPVVMYVCESGLQRKLSTEELMLLNCGVKKTLESPLHCKEILPVLIYSLEGLVLKLKHQCFVLLMQTTDTLEKTLMLGKIEGRRRRG